MRKFCAWLCAGLLLSGCASSTASSGKEIKVAGVALRLQSEANRVSVSYDGPVDSGQVDLEIEGPCEWMRDHRGGPLAKTYKDLGQATVLIVVGRLAHVVFPNGTRERCGSQTQAIIIHDGRVSASKRIVRDGRWCPALGTDEKEFWLFGHSR